MARTQAADAVPHIDAIETARSLDGAVVNGKGHGVSLTKRNDFRPRLHAGTLLGEHELSARKILAGLGKQDRHLDWENVLAVEILVQAIVVSLGILKQQRRGLPLAGMVTSLEEVGEFLRIAGIDGQRGIPAVRDGRKFWIEGGAKSVDDFGQRVREVLVFAASEAVTGHDDAAAKEAVVGVESREIFTLLGRQDAFENGGALGIEVARDPIPIELVDTGDYVLGSHLV